MPRLLRLPAVMELVGLGRSSIYNLVKLKKFPAPILIGKRAVAWVESEIHAWIAQTVESARKPDAPVRKPVAQPKVHTDEW